MLVSLLNEKKKIEKEFKYSPSRHSRKIRLKNANNNELDVMNF